MKPRPQIPLLGWFVVALAALLLLPYIWPRRVSSNFAEQVDPSRVELANPELRPGSPISRTRGQPPRIESSGAQDVEALISGRADVVSERVDTESNEVGSVDDPALRSGALDSDRISPAPDSQAQSSPLEEVESMLQRRR